MPPSARRGGVMSEPILEMRRVSKSFFSIKALRDVDLTVYAGEIHALMGENGAGKSTLMKILSGAYRPDPGSEIRIDGQPVQISRPLGGRVTGLRDGTLVGSLDKADIRADTIVRMMVGRDVSSFYKKEHDPRNDPNARSGAPVLAAVDIADGRRVKGCSLTVHAGEVVGLAGLIGAGRTELAHLIIGASPMTSGHLEMEGRAVTIRTPGEALDAGIAYLTEDRKTLGLFLDMSCLDNINLAVLGRDAKLGYILDRDKARDCANRAFATLGIRAANVGVTAGGLSGGNQQKVLLSRLLATTPKVLILDEPTRGVDVGAKSEIYSIIDNSAKSGTAILVISSDLPEIIGICDRVIVMRAGRIAGEIAQGATSPLNQEDIMAFATGPEQLDAS